MRPFWHYILLILVSCNAPEVELIYDENANFQNYHTFDICKETLSGLEQFYPEFDTELGKARLESAILSEMLALGYQRQEVDPDLLVVYKVVVNDKEQTIKNCMGNEETQYWPECRPEAFRYKEGTLVVILSDLAANQVVWQATASRILPDNVEEVKNQEEIIDKSIEAMFENFPR